MPFWKRNSAQAAPTLKIFYSSDIHGSERCFLKFLNAAKFYGAQALIMGGDLTGKLLVPLVEDAEGYHGTLFGQELRARDEAELAEVEKRVRFNGFYPYRCRPDTYARLEAEPAYREQVFAQVMLESVRRWVSLAEERLRGTGVRCLIMAGNDDELAIDSALGGELVENPDGRVVDLDGYQVIGESWVPPTPWQSPRELPEEEIERRIAGLADRLDPAKPAIFVLHTPPYRTGLDDAPQLRDDLSVVQVGGQIQMQPVGSRAVRRVIERYQPLLALHGHIHESRGASQIGRTLCINPGSTYGEGVLHGALITLAGERVAAHQLVSG